jgi:hypothetical protein
VHATVSGTALTADATTAAIVVGSNDWISTAVTVGGALTSVLAGANPGFVSATDLHLAAGSPVLGAGLGGVTSIDGMGATVSGVPDQEFLSPVGTGPRAPGSVLDLGAYGYPRPGDAGTPDGGATDAGSVDGGAPDGGSEAGRPGPGPGASSPEVTGSCSSAGTGLPWLSLAVLALLALRRREVNS